MAKPRLSLDWCSRSKEWTNCQPVQWHGLASRQEALLCGSDVGLHKPWAKHTHKKNTAYLVVHTVYLDRT